MTNTKKLIVDSRGAGTQEYLIAAVLIGVVGIGGFTTLGGSMGNAIAGESQAGVAVVNGGAMVVSNQAGESCVDAVDMSKCLAERGVLVQPVGGPTGVDPALTTGGGAATAPTPTAVDTSKTMSNSNAKGGGSSGNSGKSSDGDSGGGGCGFLGLGCAADAVGSAVDFIKPSNLIDAVLPGDGFVGDDGLLGSLPGFGEDGLFTKAIHGAENMMPGNSWDCALILMPVGPLACGSAILGGDDNGKISKSMTSARRTGANAHHQAELDGGICTGGGADAVLCNAAEKARAGAVDLGNAALAGLFSGQAATAPGTDPAAAAGGGSAGGGSSGSTAAVAPPPPPPLPPEEEIDVDGDGQPDTGVVEPGTDDGTTPVGANPGTPATPVDPGPGGTPPVGSGTTNEPVVNDPSIGGPTTDGTPTGATDVTPTMPVDSPVGPNTQIVGPFFEGPGHVDDPAIDENGDGILDNDATPAGYADDPTLDENNDGIFDNDGIAVDSDGDGIADGTLDANGVIDTGAGQGAQDTTGTTGGGATGNNCRQSRSGNGNAGCTGSSGSSNSGNAGNSGRGSHPGH